MGNYRFRLSDMVPNAWFYKLKDMSTNSKNRNKSQTKKKQTWSSSLSSSSSSIFSSKSSNLPQTKTHNNNLSCERKSYYFSRNLSPKNNPTLNNINISVPPKKSSKKKRSISRKSISPKPVNSTVSAGCNCRASLESVWTKDNSSTPEDYPNSPFSSSSNFSSEQESSLHSPKTFDSMILSASCHCKIDIDMKKNDYGFDSVSKIDLPPILTKPKILQDSTDGTKKTEHKSLSVKIVKEEERPKRRVSVRSSSNGGVKLRTKSPRIVSRKSVSSNTKTSVGESFAVVKSSKDPQRDFKESMVEMIVENNIRTSKDLEQLLACYLSLNSDQYHDLIIKVFKQIWFDITDIQLK